MTDMSSRSFYVKLHKYSPKKAYMKLNVQRAMVLLLVLIVGGVAGYFIGISQTPPIGPVAERTVEQMVADTRAHPVGENRGQLRVVTNQGVVMVVPYGKDRRCSIDYGGTLRKESDLPKEFNSLATETDMDSPHVTNVLLTYHAPAKETGRLYADTPTCEDGEQIAATSLTFEQAQVPASQ